MGCTGAEAAKLYRGGVAELAKGLYEEFLRGFASWEFSWATVFFRP